MRLRDFCAICVAGILSFHVAPVAATYVPCLPGSGGDLKTDSPSPLVVTIDTAWYRQTIRGFGASDAWSTQFVGQWPQASREAIADLLFQTGLDDRKNPRGIGLSMWRFNLGAGSTRQNNMSDTWHRADTFLNAAFNGYDWSRCPGQRWFLQVARGRGVERFIAYVTRGESSSTDNLTAYKSLALEAGRFWKGLIDEVRVHDRVVQP